ncbi:ribosomal protein S18-alanine N-acetyltransferase [Thermodesulfobacteriota bacterium]
MTSIVEITKDNYLHYLDQILEIENLSFISPWSPHAFKSELNNPASSLWVLIVNEVLSGYSCFWVFDSEIQLLNIAVHADKRGQGFGRLLMNSIIDTGVSKGIQSIWLEVRPSNRSAKNLYFQLGFEEIGRRKHYYRDTGEDAIVMALSLPQKGHYHLVSN